MIEKAAEQVLFSEWQLPNPTSFLPNLLFAPAIWLVFAPIDQTIGTFAGITLTIATIALRFLVAKIIIVSSQTLSIGKADIPRAALGHSEAIDGAEQFAERGSRLDARAFLALKSGLPGLVKITVIDQTDPTPYLLVATRKPDQLIKALSAH
jgi:hypothetical protein